MPITAWCGQRGVIRLAGGDVRPSEKAVKRTQGKTWFDMVVAV